MTRTDSVLVILWELFLQTPLGKLGEAWGAKFPQDDENGLRARHLVVTFPPDPFGKAWGGLGSKVTTR